MTDKAPVDNSHKEELINYWMKKALESLEAAQSKYHSERYTPAIRKLYYACFYALTAVLLKQGLSFKRYTAVKAALHKNLIRSGIVAQGWGKFYNKIFDSRHEGDYQPLRVFEVDEVKMFLEQGSGFIKTMEDLLTK